MGLHIMQKGFFQPVGWLLPLLFLGFGFFLGTLFRETPPAAPNLSQGEQVYTCSMDPQVRLKTPGKCPLCGMDLILATQAPSTNSQDLTLSPEAMALAEVETTEVVRRPATMRLNLYGKIAPDESRIANISARIAGRVERLYVNFTGIQVKKGEHLAEIYSPQVHTAFEEYVNLLKNSPRESTLLQATRQRLLYWGISEEQIIEAGKTLTPAFTITIHAPIGGTVVKKEVVEGLYVGEGMPLYTILDLERVWANFEAYESDLQWLRAGQKVEFTFPAQPGNRHSGRILFIQPLLDPSTRTTRVRVDIENPHRLLKPDMFLNGIVEIPLDAEGNPRVERGNPRFVCPMHPQIIRDREGECDECQMKLLPFEQVHPGNGLEGAGLPLLIPSTAPLITGRRAMVFVKTGPASFQPREVRLRGRAGDYYVVTAGLKEGERVVSRGNFKIDSALQLSAQPSFLTLAADSPPPPVGDTVNQESRIQLFKSYLSIVNTLARDREEGIEDQWNQFEKGYFEAHPKGHPLATSTSPLTKGLAGHRHRLRAWSERLFVELKDSQPPIPLHWAHCPMAFDGEGAGWLQEGTEILNPYFGAQMLHCGSIKQSFKVDLD